MARTLRSLDVTRSPLVPLALLFAAAASAAPPDDTLLRVERRDGTVETGGLSVMKNGRFFLDTARGSVDVPLDDLALVTAVDPPDAPDFGDGEPPDVLLLASPDGATGSAGGEPGVDALFGRLVAGDEYGMTLALEGGRPVPIPFELIDRVLPRMTGPADRLARLEGAGFDDRVWRRREDGGLDGVAGIVDVVTGDVVRIESSVGELAFDVDDVLGVVLAAAMPGELPDAGGPAVVVRLAGGSRFAGRVLRAGGGEVVLATRFADEVVVPTAQLADLVVADPRSVPLASLEPVTVSERPTLGGTDDVLHPWRRHWSVTGEVLSTGGVPRATGLGVHAIAELSFEVPEGARAFRVTAGLSDEVADIPAEASVTFTLLVDGEPRETTGVVAEGDEPVVLRVPLAGASTLTLRVDDGGDDDAGDRAVWADGLFVVE